jgi:hypothetical protein
MILDTESYTRVRIETYQGINLDKNLAEVEETIKMLDDSINDAKANNSPIQGYENLKNELYFLKFEILERT